MYVKYWTVNLTFADGLTTLSLPIGLSRGQMTLPPGPPPIQTVMFNADFNQDFA
jgi:hypothetical protein